jgi:hypothetical protein
LINVRSSSILRATKRGLTRICLVLLCGAALTVSRSVAAEISVSDTGLLNPDQTISFSLFSGVPNQAVSTEYAAEGLRSISPALFYDANPGGCSFFNLGDDCLSTFAILPDQSLGGFVSQFSLLFDPYVSSAALTIVTNDDASITLSVLFDDQILRTQSFTGSQDSSQNIYSVTGSAFNRIDVSLGDGDVALIGNLQFASVPEPPTALSMAFILAMVVLFARRVNFGSPQSSARRSR